MVKRDQIIKYINDFFGEDLMEKSENKDEMANGVQIKGKHQVQKISLGVSLSQDFLKEAIKSNSEFCIFHHGFDPRVYKGRFSTAAQKRLELIFKSRLTIVGLHYLLDAHPEIGNNASIIKKLGAKIGEPFFDDWGFLAGFDKVQDIKKLAQKCAEIFEHDVFAVYSGPKKIKKIAVVSGSGKPYTKHLNQMEEKAVELFISGETAESIPNKMKEMGINYFACGHYATETFGIQEFGKKLKNHFKDKVEVEFIDIPNPI